ncbi:MAG: AbgT family transporter [Pseudomonadales bacterium]|nr:AbgT family transporter [Pseudomonadales bacterium]
MPPPGAIHRGIATHAFTCTGGFSRQPDARKKLDALLFGITQAAGQTIDQAGRQHRRQLFISLRPLEAVFFLPVIWWYLTNRVIEPAWHRWAPMQQQHRRAGESSGDFGSPEG